MNNVKEFFDSIAKNWDQMEEKNPSDIQALLKEIGIQKGEDVLDVACGTGIITGFLHDFSNVDVKAIDLSPKMIEIAKKKYEGKAWANFECVDLMDYKASHLFDVIVIYNAYPHFLEPEKLSKKIASLLKNEGRLAILHSLGREELAKHHSGKQVHPISRDLSSPKEEYGHFEKQFVLSRAEEGKHHYFLFMKKR